MLCTTVSRQIRSYCLHPHHRKPVMLLPLTDVRPLQMDSFSFIKREWMSHGCVNATYKGKPETLRYSQAEREKAIKPVAAYFPSLSRWTSCH